MRCSVCLFGNPHLAVTCSSCRSRLDENRHRELWGIHYLLGQLGRWEEEDRFTPAGISDLRDQYTRKRDALREDLLPVATPAAPARPKVEVLRTLAAPVTVTALRAEPMKPHAPARPAVPPAPPRPPFSWKNLYTEKNIRWILNLGIFIFSVALAVFIHTQWKGMAAGTKISILFGASFAAMVAGHLLRRTMLKATGMALVLLGAIALPIDCYALLQFKIIARSSADLVGLGGSVLSLAVYLGLARLYREPLFLHLAALAGTSLWAFVLKNAGLAWPQVPPWITPVALAARWLRNAPLRFTAFWIHVGALSATLGLVFFGLLTPRLDVVALEVAIATAIAGTFVRGLKDRPRGLDWLVVSLLGVMVAGVVGHFELAFNQCWLIFALLGAAYAIGWGWRLDAYLAGSVVAGGLSLVAGEGDLHKLTWILAIPAGVHVGFGLWRDDSVHAFAGWLLAGIALAVGLNAAHVPPLRQPLHFALYGVAMLALSRVRTREVFHFLGALGAGAAMFLLALRYLQYYLPKPAPAGQSEQLLGAAIAAVSALVFGQLANRMQSRFVSDITYGCIGFAYLLVLRWAHVPGKWLGLSMALLGLAYVLFEKRISRVLLRPTLFTGVATTVAAAVFATLQWWVWREYLQSSLTFFLIGGFYLAVAQKTAYKWLSHVGTYVCGAGWLVAMELLKIPDTARPFLTFLPAGWMLMVAVRREDRHLTLAGLTVALASLAFAYLNVSMYLKPQLPMTIATSFAAAALAGWFAFCRPEPSQGDVRLMSGLMGLFASAGYVLWLKFLSRGSPWGGLSIFAMSAALCVAADILRRRGFLRQAWPLTIVSLIVTPLAVLVALQRGTSEGVHLWVLGLSLAMYTRAGRSFGLPVLSWFGAAAGAVGLLAWIEFWDTRWIGVWTSPIAALALLKKARPLQALGFFAAAVLPLHAATRLYQEPAAGLVFIAMTALLAFSRIRLVSYYTSALAVIISFGHEPWNTWTAFAGFAIYLGLALGVRRPHYLYAALILALLGDYHQAIRSDHAGLLAFPLAAVLLGMAYQVGRRYGNEFGWPLLGASIAAAVLSTILALGHPVDRIWVFLGDALLFGVSAALFRRPELMYPCSAALVALDIALMLHFKMEPRAVAFQLLTLALTKVIFIKAMGDRMRSYLQPIFVAALALAGGVLGFGLYHHEHYLAREGGINLAIWGLILVALIAGVAGRIRKIPAFVYMAAGNLLGAYYLTLHKYSIETLELYTIPIGIGLVIWSGLALREKGPRGLIEGLAVGFFFVPSSVQSYLPDGEAHTLAALGLAFGLVLLGMAMKRRVYLFGGTGAFILEVVGKALEFLIEKELSFAEWGMILGGLMILVAAAFESRKMSFVKDQLELARAGANKYFASWP